MTREEFIKEMSDVTYHEISLNLQAAFGLKDGYELREVVCAMVSPDEDYNGDDDVPEGSVRVKRLLEKSLDLSVPPITSVLDFMTDAENFCLCNPNVGEMKGVVVVELEYSVPGGRVHFFRTEAGKFIKAITVTKEGMMLREVRDRILGIINDLEDEDDKPSLSDLN